MSSISNIRIAIIGSVSVGKSTLLNALFVEQLSTTKMKRTTVLPSLFIEDDLISLKQNIKQIKENIDNKNKELITKTESDVYHLTLKDCSVITNFISKIFDITNPINSNIKLEIFDIPGLDDRKTKDVYFEWVKNNFHRFDIILFMTKIDSGLNTIGEMEILQKIIDNIYDQKNKYNRTVYLIPIINKCDNMFYNSSTQSMEFNESNEEYYDMVNQVNNIIETEFRKKDMESFTKAVLLSAEEMFVYRTIYESRHVDNIELDDKYINKIAINEYGKTKWNEYKKAGSYVKYRQEILNNLRSEKHKYNEYMQSCGYTLLNNTLNKILLDHTKDFLQDHIKYEITNRPDLDKLDLYLQFMVNIYNDEQRINTLLYNSIYNYHNFSYTQNALKNDIIPYVKKLCCFNEDVEKSLIVLVDSTNLTNTYNNYMRKLENMSTKLNVIYEKFKLIYDDLMKKYLEKYNDIIQIHMLITHIFSCLNPNIYLKFSNMKLFIDKILKLEPYFIDCKPYLIKYNKESIIDLSLIDVNYVIVVRNLNNIFNNRSTFIEINNDSFLEFINSIDNIFDKECILDFITLYLKYKLNHIILKSTFDFYYLCDFKFLLYKNMIKHEDKNYVQKLIKGLLILVEHEISSYYNRIQFRNELYKSNHQVENEYIIYTKNDIDLTIEKYFFSICDQI
jgi:GTPase SAR1 family protein